MTMINLGKLDWGANQDSELHRNYWIKFLIETDSDLDGPAAIALGAPGLPVAGAAWNYGNDTDNYALCRPEMECETVIKNEKNFHWILKFAFSTRPWRTCATSPITTPLSQPAQISGNFVNYQERTCRRRDGTMIASSSLEPIWYVRDRNRPTVSVVQTVLDLQLATLASMIDTLNDATLWGLPKRCWKLRNTPWRRLVWGKCAYYYQRDLQFDGNYETWDKSDIRDIGKMVIDPDMAIIDPALDPTDPNNYMRATDGRGNILPQVLLSPGVGATPLLCTVGRGEMCPSPATHIHYIPKVEHYNESNFLTLGIPTTL